MRFYFYRVLIPAFLSIVFITAAASAHPHIFLSNSIQAVFSEKGLEGFESTWVADEFSTMGLLDGYDENEDGKVDSSELAIFENDSFTHLKTSNYFSHVTIDKKKFIVSSVTDFKASLEDGKITYSFFTPCKAAAESVAKEITISQYDSSYFTFIGFEKNNPAGIKPHKALTINYEIAENKNESYYFGQVHPTALILRFKRK